MYLALTEMNVRLPDCTVATIAPGEEVPDFANWPTWTQQAMLQEQQVRWAPGGGELTPREKQLASRVVMQRVPDRVLGPPPKEEPAPAGPELYVPGRSAHVLPEGLQAAAVDADATPKRKRGRPAKADVAKAVEPAAAPAQAPASEDAPIVAQVNAPRHNDGVQAHVSAPMKKGAHDCPACDRQGFKDFAALQIHMAAAHQVED